MDNPGFQSDPSQPPETCTPPIDFDLPEATSPKDEHSGVKLVDTPRLSSSSFKLPNTDTLRKYKRLSENISVTHRAGRVQGKRSVTLDQVNTDTSRRGRLVAGRRLRDKGANVYCISPSTMYDGSEVRECVRIPPLPQYMSNTADLPGKPAAVHGNNRTEDNVEIKSEIGNHKFSKFSRDEKPTMNSVRYHTGHGFGDDVQVNPSPWQSSAVNCRDLYGTEKTNKAPCRGGQENPVFSSPADTFDTFLNQQNDKKIGDIIPTVAFAVPMYYEGLTLEQPSPKASTENRRNHRQSSKLVKHSGDQDRQVENEATLTKQGIYGWKLSFIKQNTTRGRSGLVILCLGLVISLLVALGTALYINYPAKDADWLNSEVVSPEEMVQGESEFKRVNGSFRILNVHYVRQLSDATSTEFQQISREITAQLNAVFATSVPLKSHYNYSRVSFPGDPGSPATALTVNCWLIFATLPAFGEVTTMVGVEFLRALRLRKGAMWLGDFHIDVTAISFYGLQSAPASAPSQDLTFFPNWTPWSDWSPCESLDASVGTTSTRTRFCRLNNGTGEILSNIEPCLLTEGSGDLEVRECGSVDETLVGAGILQEESVPVNAVQEATVTRRGDGQEGVVTLSQTTMMFNLTNVTVTSFENVVNRSALEVAMGMRSTPRHCDDCTTEEVCIALAKEDVPTCRHLRDPHDPTGCGGHCQLGVEFCRKLDVDAYRCLDDNSCFEDEFQCANRLCIPSVKRCDGHKNCYDETDETNCDCDLTTHFHCKHNTSCLPKSKRCDRVIDCWDGSDEANCTKACPLASQFTCTNGDCIPRSYFCDCLPDCTDKTDEPFGCCSGKCLKYEWKCKNGRCITSDGICDHKQDCGDGSDEENCGAVDKN